MQATDTALTAVLKRDRGVIIAAMAILTLLAWAYVLWLSFHMPISAASDGMAGMDMSDMPEMDMSRMAEAVSPAFTAWSPADFIFTFMMWTVMMVGMMTPSVAPMVLLYASVGRQAAGTGTTFAPTGWFYAGYLTVWLSFSALATFAQWILVSAALLTPMMESTSTLFGGLVLIAAGLYQWTPLKDTCLRACQSPIGFLMARGGFRAEPAGAFSLGLAHGAYCCGCCIALMALLFVGGVMNVLWIAGLTILLFLEKVVPAGRIISRISGSLIGAAGIYLLVKAV